MPIIVKDYTWTQTDKLVHIRIPLKDAIREKVDLFTTDSYIKVHFSPYIFEVFLLHDVDNDKSMCIVKDDLITLDLRKREETEWECLEKQLTKAEKMKLRQEILEQCQEKAKQASEDKNIKKSQLDRFTVQQAMEIDSAQHALMDKRRNEERNNAMDALEQWRVNAERNPKAKFNSAGKIVELDENFKTVEIKDDNEPKIESAKIIEITNDKENEKQVTNNESFPRAKIVALPNEKQKEMKPKVQVSKPVKTPVRSEFVEKKKEEVAKRVLPRLREGGQLEITHTPRTFPTPSRESYADEEQAWLKNITLARRATGFASEDLRPEEQDPQWCKAKGDEFFKAGNFLGAISAYSHGITLSDKFPSLYANRSATHFALGNFNKCLQDCSTALDLMKPPCEGNRLSRAKCIARRGAALARLGYLSKGIDEMKAASKMVPDNEDIKKDIYDMERAWEQNPDSD